MGAALIGFARFWYAFIVGDDWTVAAGVIASLAVTRVLALCAVPAWWTMPLAAGALLVTSLRRAARTAR